MADVLADLQPIFRDILDQPELVVSRESDPLNVDGWDSLAHVNLITTIEKNYQIRFSLDELQKLRSVGEIVDLIEVKLATS